jgi:hypothetical protein
MAGGLAWLKIKLVIFLQIMLNFLIKIREKNDSNNKNFFLFRI